MTTLRTAAQQALEYLDAPSAKLWPAGTQHRIITALRTALEQEQAEPVQEPVAFIHRQGNHWEVSERHLDEDERDRGWTEEPLYTAPPKRKPLTEEEIDAVWDQWFGAYGLRGPGGPYTRRGFARAVERAHRIPMPETPRCTDCWGIGYDASGQLCACQQNPSFG